MTNPLTPPPMSDAEINAVLDAAKVSEPPEGFEFMDLSITRPIIDARDAQWLALVGELQRDADIGRQAIVLFAQLLDQLGERDRGDGNAPGHCHEIPGIWDSDNGKKAGKQCAWCATWNEAKRVRAAIDAALSSEGKGEEG